MVPTTDLVEIITKILENQPGLDNREIATVLREQEFPMLIPKINSILYGHRDRFKMELGRKRHSERPVWYPVQPDAAAVIDVRQSTVGAIRRILGESYPPDHLLNSLYQWQERALAEWLICNRRGVIEAVTGGGKTRLALAAAALELRAGGRVLVIVPTKDLVEQWVDQIEKHLGSAMGRALRVGRFDGDNDGYLWNDEIVVATVQKACRYRCFPPNLTRGLLIADECHHYAAGAWRHALQPEFAARLGLTATYERDDNGIQEVLDPYFGGVCYRLDYGTALAEEVIAHFKIAFVGVSFLPDEQLSYDAESEKLNRYKRRLINEYGVSEGPLGVFMQEVARLGKSGDGAAARVAGLYLSAFTKRRAVLASASKKLCRLHGLVPAIKRAHRSIVFGQTNEAATTAVEALRTDGVDAAVLHSGMDMDDRRRVFAAFDEGDHELIAAPKLLDEGIDVPSADLAVILATSRSRRQMIQRMGRVVRRKADNRLARIAVLFVEGTCEDPSSGAHEDFIDMVVEVADEMRVFGARESDDAVVDYLNQWWPRSL
ncbi:MAG TPA: DEAD/DEAH box helicase [Edaphobacter sp.]|uniref:DEAD/DEAH box helicase n=1 Tax=Edaphobacter sp. TaxID=1934404 RepID=UPI002C66DCBE|nr:DEAD/DEAH box helicase [Edaphobacter sp.]HUZ93533.1 DEAD/DEAH box helicase [Edaphobacter sp.]